MEATQTYSLRETQTLPQIVVEDSSLLAQNKEHKAYRYHEILRKDTCQ